MSNSFRVMRIGGIDVYVNWSWLLAVAFFTWSLGDYYNNTFKGWGSGTAYIVGAISAILLFVTVLIHELSHSFTARANGLPVHTITLFIFGGVSNLSEEPQTPKVELLVAIAGPLASLALAAGFFLLHAVGSGWPSQVVAVLGYLASVNLILAIFNLIPGFPLDGGRVLRATAWLITGNLRKATRIAAGVGDVIGYLFIAAGLLEALVLGAVISGLWLAFIGWFLHNAATATAQQSVVDRLLMGIEVRRVMDAVPASVPPDTPLEALVYRHMLTGNQRVAPVTDFSGTLLGLVTLADLREIPREEWNVVPVERVMTPFDKLVTAAPGDDLRTALKQLAENGHHQLPVVIGDRLVGILDRSHVVQYLHMRRQLEAARGSDVPPDVPPSQPLQAG